MAIQLFDYQETGVNDIRQSLRVHNAVLYVLPTGGGKCFAAGTPVLMFDGTIKLVENVQAGDLLMGPDGGPRRVTSLAHGREEMYRIVPSVGEAYVVNESHIVSLRNISGQVRNEKVRYAKFLVDRLNPQWFGWRVPGVMKGDFRGKIDPILSIRQVGLGDYYGFELEGSDRLFLLGDFTVTHNTYTFSYIADSAARKGNRATILVHRKELLLQASKSLSSLGVPHGMISPHFTPSPTELVQVASIDTLLKRMEKRKYATDLLIPDEAHHVIAGNKWGRCYDMLGRPKTLGFTATPIRGDGIGLGVHAGGLFQDMVLGPTPSELIGRGRLMRPVVYSNINPPDLTGVRKNSKGEWIQNQLAERLDKPAIIGSAVEHYRKYCPGAKTIVFCVNVVHAKHVVDEFNAAGFRFALLVGAPEMSDGQRTKVNEGLALGTYQGAVTVDLVSEGYDLPSLECCIMLRSTESESLFIQQAGRVMRYDEGKTRCILLDHVGNVGSTVDGQFIMKHGLPDMDREWSLDGAKKRSRKADNDEDEIKIRQCGQCYAVHEAAPQCPSCGYVYTVRARKIERVDGQLHQITEDMAEQIRRSQWKDQARARDVESLVAIGHSRGRAEKIIQSRIEKDALREELCELMMRWFEITRRPLGPAFGFSLTDVKRTMKPKALKQGIEDVSKALEELGAGHSANNAGQRDAAAF